MVMDVDGTLTDGGIYIGNDGELMKRFNAKDGYAIANMLPQMNIIPAIITGRKSHIVENRCKELGIRNLIQGSSDKLSDLRNLCNRLDIDFQQTAYIGDDMNDYSVMSIAGFKACPADATEEIRGICDYVSSVKGGDGAVRDIVEYLHSKEF